jgi:hypothetical protein
MQVINMEQKINDNIKIIVIIGVILVAASAVAVVIYYNGLPFSGKLSGTYVAYSGSVRHFITFRSDNTALMGVAIGGVPVNYTLSGNQITIIHHSGIVETGKVSVNRQEIVIGDRTYIKE